MTEESEERAWIERKAIEIDQKLKNLKDAGIDVYPFTDFIVFPQSIWDKYGKEIISDGVVHGTGGHDERARKPNLNNNRTQELLKAQIHAIFTRFPQLDGITLRFGETYLHDTPFHMGGSPIREGNNAIEDHILLLNILREEICIRLNKKLFYRTWDFGFNFHNNLNYYLAVTDQIEPHPNLIFSIKYQQDDFLRMTPFNPTLGKGKHSQIFEAQSRMEAYGKGAHPYYTAKGVIDGWPETKYEIEFGTHRFTGKLNEQSAPRGIKDILSEGKIKGVMTWSHGGGWQGPYISHEIWTDLNTYILLQWAQNPRRSEEEIFKDFTKRLNLKEQDADIFRQIALLSIEAVRKGQCNSYARNDMWWARDDFFCVKCNDEIIEEILKNGVEDKVLAEKAEASAMWLQIEALSRQLECPDMDVLKAIQVFYSPSFVLKYQQVKRNNCYC